MPMLPIMQVVWTKTAHIKWRKGSATMWRNDEYGIQKEIWITNNQAHKSYFRDGDKKEYFSLESLFTSTGKTL